MFDLPDSLIVCSSLFPFTRHLHLVVLALLLSGHSFVLFARIPSLCHTRTSLHRFHTRIHIHMTRTFGLRLSSPTTANTWFYACVWALDRGIQGARSLCHIQSLNYPDFRRTKMPLLSSSLPEMFLLLIT